MSNSIKLSPKYGVNPTIPVCFWCGKERNEIALLGHIGDGRKHEDIEAPKNLVLDFEPCEKCQSQMALGFTVMEATREPNATCNHEMQSGVYPTGRFVVMKTKVAEQFFGKEFTSKGKAFMEPDVFNQMFGGVHFG